MKTMSILTLLLAVVSTCFAVAKAPAAGKPELLPEVTLPPKDTTLYWNIRSEAVSELIPYLTRKRSEFKEKTKFLADYLLKIDKASEFAAADIKAPEDPQYYAEILNLTKSFQEAKIEIPEKRPTWDELVEIAMQHVMYEGYIPTEVEGEDEALMYQELCKKKEEYGQKVRKDLHDILQKGVRMWIYLGKINEQGNAKARAADMILEKKAADAEVKAQLTDEKRQASLQRQQARIDQKEQDAMDRASFRSSRHQREFDARQDRLRYRQSRLDERYTNSRRYYW